MEEKEEIKLLKKASKLEKTSMKYFEKNRRTNEIIDFMNKISPKRSYGLIDTKVFGFLRSNGFKDALISATEGNVSDKLILIPTALGSFILDILTLPFTLSASIVMNTLKFTGLFGAMRKGLKRRSKRLCDKKTNARQKVYEYLEKNDLIDKKEFERSGNVKAENWNKHFDIEDQYGEPYLNSTDLKNIAELKKDKGDMAGYEKYNSLYKLANENVWGNSKKQETAEEQKVEKEAEITKIETEQKEFSKIVDACKKSGMNDEETMRVLEESGFSKVPNESNVTTENIEVAKNKEDAETR